MKKQYIVIVGCGRFGSYVANIHSKTGSSVVVIDPNPGSFSSLSSDFSGFTVEGDASEFAVLKQAKLDKADLFIAATEKDAINIFAARVAKQHFLVPEVVARVYDPEFTAMLADNGITAICPALISVEQYFSAQPEQSERKS